MNLVAADAGLYKRSGVLGPGVRKGPNGTGGLSDDKGEKLALCCCGKIKLRMDTIKRSLGVLCLKRAIAGVSTGKMLLTT